MGEADSLFLSEARRTVKRNKEYTSLIVVPDAGHACNIDNKEFFNSTSINYLLA
jgi:pimeloyl-ACP methyl ester carboxylesterase